MKISVHSILAGFVQGIIGATMATIFILVFWPILSIATLFALYGYLVLFIGISIIVAKCAYR